MKKAKAMYTIYASILNILLVLLDIVPEDDQDLIDTVSLLHNKVRSKLEGDETYSVYEIFQDLSNLIKKYYDKGLIY